MLNAEILSPLANAIRTRTTFPVAFDMFSVPSVIVYPPLNDVPVKILSAPVNAQPLLPLPLLSVLAPGMPDPAYCVAASSHPFSVDDESIAVPGAAIHNPLIPELDVILMSKLATACLRKANVKYCVPVSAERFGPAGK